MKDLGASDRDLYDTALLKQICSEPWKDPESYHRIIKALEPAAEWEPGSEEETQCKRIVQELLACAFDAQEINCPLCGATDDFDAEGKCFGEPCPVDHIDIETGKPV